MSIFEDMEDSLVEKICGACKENRCDSSTGLCDCINCCGDYTDKKCEHYSEWTEIIDILEDAEKSVNEIVDEL